MLVCRMVFFCGLALPLFAAAAADEEVTATVVVSATRIPHAGHDLPMAVDVIGKRRLGELGPRVMAAEVLNRLPGSLVQSRETLAQEPQIVLRGFGARSQFGVRGIKLLADGIPASTPDGQGGSGLFDLASAERIEVMRGAFSALYGNHSGGVVQVFTEDGPAQPELSTLLAVGAFGARQAGVKLAGQWHGMNAVVSASQWQGDGYRDWSRAGKDQLNAKLRYAPGADTSFTLVANRLEQADNQDPLGLSAAQVAANRRQANPLAQGFGTRRSLKNNQLGLIVEHELGGGDSLRAMLYGGDRSNEQYLAFSGAGATSAGGVSAFERDFWGASLRWTRQLGRLAVSTGLEIDSAKDERRGYVNTAGSKGALRRDESNTAWQGGVYVQAEWQPTADLSWHGGLRHSRVAFTSRDHYIVGANPDDSGGLAHAAWTPAVGLLYRWNDNINLYASLGRSFEAPTFIELAYRASGGSGLNTLLRPSVSDHREVGLKALLGDKGQMNLALFEIRTRDEIVVDTNLGGRTTYRNADGTQRRGLELGWRGDLGGGFAAELAATLLNARFLDGFVGSAGAVAAGNRLPGLPARTLFAELAYRDAGSGISAAVEGRWNSRVEVNDSNSEAASGYFVAGLRGGFTQSGAQWRFEEFLRIDNLFNREYNGAVYVNDGNGRYYAPAASRGYLLGMRATYRF